MPKPSPTRPSLQARREVLDKLLLERRELETALPSEKLVLDIQAQLRFQCNNIINSSTKPPLSSATIDAIGQAIAEKERKWTRYLKASVGLVESNDCWALEELNPKAILVQATTIRPRQTASIDFGKSAFYSWKTDDTIERKELAFKEWTLGLMLCLQGGHVEQLNRHFDQLCNIWAFLESDCFSVVFLDELFPHVWTVVSLIWRSHHHDKFRDLFVWLAIQVGCTLLAYGLERKEVLVYRAQIEEIDNERSVLINGARRRFLRMFESLDSEIEVAQPEESLLNTLLSSAQDLGISFLLWDCEEMLTKKQGRMMILFGHAAVHVQMEIAGKTIIWHGKKENIIITYARLIQLVALLDVQALYMIKHSTSLSRAQAIELAKERGVWQAKTPELVGRLLASY